MSIFKKKLWGQKSKKEKKGKGRANRAVIEQLEPRLLLSADLVVNAAAAADYTVKLDLTGDPTVLVVDTSETVIGSQALADTSGVVINCSNQNDSVTVDLASFGTTPVPVTFNASSGSDTLKITGKDSFTWNINNANTGMAELVIFNGVENLSGDANNQDTFIFGASGSLSGTINGGANGSDTLDYSAKTSGVTVNLGTGSATYTTGISNIENVTGGSGGDTLTGNGAANILTGGAGIDNLNGGAGNDTLNGGAGNDSLNGGANNDTLIGGLGNDTIIGGTGTDTISETRDANFTLSNASLIIPLGGGINETDSLSIIEAAILTGGGSNNTISATSFTGTVVLDGGAGNDTLRGGTGADTLIGGTGDDTLVGGRGNDIYVLNPAGSDTITEASASGTDTLDYSAFTAGVTANLATGTGTGAMNVFANIENVIGGSGDDTLTGDGNANTLTGGAGNDTLNGGAGADTLNGGVGNDILNGGAGNDTLRGGADDDIYVLTSTGGTDTITESAGEGSDTLDYSAFTTGITVNLTTFTAPNVVTGSVNLVNIENVIGGTGNDTLTGDSSVNVLTGGAGNDTLNGMGGNDTLIGGAGDDIYLLTPTGGTDAITEVAGGGTDTLNYSAFTTGVTVNLGSGTGTGIANVYTNIEKVIGGSGDDILTGDGNPNTLTGGAGNDTLSGGAGNDTLIGGAGNDTYVLMPEGGTDTITEASGGGTDTLDYSAFITGVTVNLGTATAAGVTPGYAYIENVIGGAGDDTLTGDGNANTLTGGDGNDVLSGGGGADALNGGAGNDTLSGGAGNDTLTGGAGDDTYILAPGGGTDTIIESSGGGSDTLDYSAFSNAVTVNLATATAPGVTNGFTEIENVTGGSGNDNITGDGNANVLKGGAGVDTIDAGPGNDTLIGGPGNDILTGSAGDDTYVLTPDGTDTVIEAPGGGTDSLDYSAYTDPIIFNMDDFSITGVNTLDNIEYLIGINNFVINGTTGDDTIYVENIGATDDGYMQIRWGSNTLAFAVPAESLKIEAHEGADKIEVISLDNLYSADLMLYGYESGAPEIIPDLSIDQVTFSGDAFTHGGAVEVFADKIYVNDGVTVSTLDSETTGEGKDIVFRARRIYTSELTNFLPVDVYLRKTEIVIGDNASLLGGGIYLFSQAEDRDLSVMLGTDWLVNEFVLEPLENFVSGLTALPVKVIYKESEATITVGQGAHIVGTGTVGLYATAAANATGEANSKYGSIGYGDARATASVDIAGGALIQSTGGAVVITSDANATASIKTETEQSEGDSGLAGSIAVTNAVATSTVTLASGAKVEAYKTANLRAQGNITSESEAKGSTTENGIAGLGFSLSFSDSDIHTQVDGTIIAHVQGDYLVKLEIDPLAVLNTEMTVSELKSGDMVELLSDFGALPAGTLLEYKGSYLTGTIDLSEQNYSNGSLWVQTTTPPEGYVDYVNDKIYVGNSGLVTEDVINYDSRRGTPIGGLIDDNDYVIIDLGNGWIKLALTEQNAIDNEAINLTYSTDPGEQLTLNTKDFDGSDIDPNRSRIRLDNSAWSMSDNEVDWQLLGLTFELGQAVVYHAARDAQGNLINIDGLIDGHTYYIITGIDEFDLQGDSRWVQEQWVQLAETEMEARAGANISFKLDSVSAAATGFRLEAKHVLDSGLSNGIGVLSVLKAEDKASAEAGVQPEDTPLFDISDFPLFDESIFDTIVGALMSSGGTNAAQAGANNAGVQGSPVTVAGAFAFSLADHHVTTDVGGSAVLKSNEDLEVKATIEHEVQLSAETDTGLPESKNGQTPATGGGDASVSIAVDLGIFTTDAEATVHSGAELDALRATRVISLVQHPYITSPDEFFPSTLGEFMDSIKSEGYDALNKYMDGTLGLKSELFNTWARSTAEANDVGIAGSVNILTFNDTANSLVESGVLINQDEDWRDFGLNPHENNDSGAINDETKEEQVVSVEASNYMEMMNMTGIFSFDLPEGSIDPSELKLDPKLDINPVASEGGKGGVGGAIFVMTTNNNTHSTVEDGSAIYSGVDGTFNMKADEAIFNIDLGQAGAKAGTVAVGGTVMYAGQTSETIAQLESGVEVTGREASIYAASLETNIMWAGGIAKGESIGAGISVAVNDIDRTTKALIGNEETDGGTGSALMIDVAEDVTARAIVGGEIWAFTVAGAYVNTTPDNPTSNAPGGTNPTGGASTPQLFNQQPAGSPSTPPDANAQQQQQKTGIGIAAAAGVNIIKENTQASIIDVGAVEAGSISITAENRTSIVAVTGGLAFTTTKSGTAVGLAGAFSYNEIEATTIAQAENTDFDLDGNGIEWPADINDPTEVLPTVRIWSLADGKIISAAAGIAGSTVGGGGGGTGGSGGSSTAVSVAGSVSIDKITSENLAAAKNAEFNILSNTDPEDKSTGHVMIIADDDSSIFAISGGLSLSIASGQQGSSTAVSAGIAVAVNEISSDTIAALEDSTITWDTNHKGDLSVSATSDETIDAYTIAGAISDASAGTSGSGVAASGAASGSINQIDFNTKAVVKDSTVTLGTGGATVEAKDTSEITSGAGAIGIAIGMGSQGNGGAGAFGAAFAINYIGTGDEGSFVSAEIDNSHVIASSAIELKATDEADIFSVAIGAAGSVSGSSQGNAISGSLAGSASINQIKISTQALAHNGSQLTTRAESGAGISITATDNSSINATAGSAALQAAMGQNTSAAVGLGFSLTINDIDNTALAAIEDSTVVSDSTLAVMAHSQAEIESLAFGIALGLAASTNGTGVAANATGAISKNDIDNTMEAVISDTTPLTTNSITTGDTVTVSAIDDSIIEAQALAAAVSIGVSSNSASAAVSIGVGVALNSIDNDTIAMIDGVDLETTAGDVDLLAQSNAEIDALALAASASFSGSGGGITISVSPDVSYAENDITNTTEAVIEGGSIDAKTGAVSLEATDNSRIKSDIVAAAVSMGFTGGSAAISVSLAGTIGENDIANETRAVITEGAYIDAGTTVDLSAASTSKIDAIGVSASVAGSGSGGSLSVSGAGALAFIDNEIGGTVEASIDDGSSVDAVGSVSLSATNTPDIDTTVVAASLAAGGSSSVAVNVSLAVATALNDITTTTRAAIDASDVISSGGAVSLKALSNGAITAYGVAAGISAGGSGSVSVNGSASAAAVTNTIDATVEAVVTNNSLVEADDSVSISATDTSDIDATVVAASFAAGGSGSVDVEVSLAAAVALNDFGTITRAAIEGSDVTSSGGDVTLSALSNGSITTYGAGGGVAVGGSGAVAVHGTGAGAVATADTSNLTETVITGHANVIADIGDVKLTATDSTALNVDVLGVAVTGGGSQVEVDVALSFAVAQTDVSGVVRSKIEDSTVTASLGDVLVTSLDNTLVDTDGKGVSVSIGGAVYFALEGAGTGVYVSNTVGQTVEALIVDSDVTAGGQVAVHATDDLELHADALAAAVSASGGITSGSISVSAAIAENKMEGDDEVTEAVEGLTIARIGGSTVNAGSVDVNGSSSSTLEANADAYAVAVAISIGFSGAGSGGSATNTIERTTTGAIDDDSDVTSSSSVAVGAHDNSSATAKVESISITAGLTGLAIGVGLPTNTLDSSTTAYISDSLVTANGGSISVDADAHQDGEAKASIVSVSAAIGGAGAGGDANTTITSDVAAYAHDATLTASGDLFIDADSNHSANAEIVGVGAAVGFGVTAMISDTSISGETIAYADGVTTINVGSKADITADSITDAESDGTAVSFGTLVAVAVASFSADVDRVTDAYVGTRPGDTVTSTTLTVGAAGNYDDLNIAATSSHTATAEVGGASVGSVSVTVFEVEATIEGSTRGFVGQGSIVTADSVGISASADTEATASVDPSVGIGMLSGAYASATATDTHKAAAFVGPAAGKTAGAASSITATGDVAVLANMDSSVLAEGFMVGIALGGAGSYAETTATSTPTVQAYLGDQGTIDADGDVDIKAIAEGEAIADGTGITVAVGVGYSGAEVTAGLNPTVAAFTEGSSSISGDNVTIESRLNLNEDGEEIKPDYDGGDVGPAFGKVTLGSGAILGSGAAGTVNVTNSPTMTAQVGSGTTIAADGDFILKSDAYQLAQGDGLSASAGILVGVGIVDVTTTASGTVTTAFDGTLTKAASASVFAGSKANTYADGHAGAGGGAVGSANVDITASTSPTVSTTVSGDMTASGNVTVRTEVATTVKATATAIEVGILAAGGSTTVTATAEPDIDTVVSGTITSTAGSIMVQAYHNAGDSGFLDGNKVYASVDHVNVALGVSAFESDVKADAKADVQALLDTTGTLQADKGNVIIATRSGNFAEAALENNSGAAISIDVGGDPTAEAQGQTATKVIGNINVGTMGYDAWDITVMAQAVDYAIANNKSSSGGIIEVSKSTTDATSDPTVTVQVGGAGSLVRASGDITIKALSTNDADSTNKVSGGGVINVNNYYSQATTDATVNVLVGTQDAGADTITAGGAINISAANNETATGKGGLIESVNGDDAVDGNSITFALGHNLEDGDTVTYNAGPFGSIGGITDGRQYNIMINGTKVIQLGATFDGATINTATDEIVFTTPHLLEDGDMVYYFGDVGGLTSGTKYIVNKIDDYHIKLIKMGQLPAITNIISYVSANTIHNVINNYTSGDQVTYYKTPMVAHFSSLCADAEVDGLEVQGNEDGVYTEDNDAIIADWDADGVLDAHNLTTGTALVYHASDPDMVIDGLLNGHTYYAVLIDGNTGQFKLAESLNQALGRRWEVTGTDEDGNDIYGYVYKTEYVETIELKPEHDVDDHTDWCRVDHTLTRVVDTAIPGLVDGQSYIVANWTALGFQLADTNGNIISLADGFTGSGQEFVMEGINLSSAGTGEQKLVLDIQGPATPLQSMEGGSAADFVGTSVDRTTTASASGGGGGLIDVKGGSSTSDAAATVTLTVQDATLTANTMDIYTNAVVQANAKSGTGGGGGISIGDADATTHVASTSTLSIESDAVLTATGDIKIQSKSDLDGDASAKTDVIGILGSGVDADSKTYIDYATTTEIDATITAGTEGKLTIEARTLIDGTTTAWTDGSGIGADSDANHGSHDSYGVLIGKTKATNLVDIQPNALLSAKNVELNAIVDLKAKAESDAYAEAVGTDCDSGANIEVNGTTNVLLETESEITGTGSVLIQSQYININLLADSHSDSDAIGGDTDAYSRIEVNTTAKVTGRDEAIIRTADLDVDTTQDITQYDRKAQKEGAWIDTGDADYNNGTPDLARDIFWESRVIMIGDEPSPEVVIDSTGKVTTLLGDVTLTDQYGNEYGLEDTFDVDDDIVVGDLVNDSFAGTAEFRANALDSGDVDEAGTPPLSQIWGNNADFEMKNTWDHVFITNNSDRDLFINDIDVLSGVGGTINVKVDSIYGWTDTPVDNVSLDENHPNKLETGGLAMPTFEFELENNFDRTYIRIWNLQPGVIADSYVVLDGFIDNPIGITEVLNERGDIVSGPDPEPELTKSNELYLTATTGTIGLAETTARLIYDNASGNFVEGEILSWGTDQATSGTGKIVNVLDFLHDMGMMWIQRLTGVSPGDGTLITGGTSGTECQVKGAIAEPVVIRSPISVELVKFTDTDDLLYDMILTADAGKDVVLDITANDRTQLGTPLRFTPEAFDVNIERITAGDDVSIVVNDSKAGYEFSPTGGVEVNLFNPPDVDYPEDLIESGPAGVTSTIPGQAQSGMYFTHFRPDGRYDDSGNVWRAFGLDSTDVDSTYKFAEVRAGDDIDIGHISTEGLTGEAEPRSYELTQITLTDTDQDGVVDVAITPETVPDTTINFIVNTDVDWTAANPAAELDDVIASDVPQIFLTTNGNIVANELVGNMLVGHVHSTAGDVTLSTVSGSILDALGDTVSDVDGRSIDIDANGGSIGDLGGDDDLEIDSLRVGSDPDGDDVGLEAGTGIYLTEMDGKLRLVLAHSYTGDIRLTVNETTPALDEDLELIESGTAFTAETNTNQWRTVAHGQIFAETGNVLLYVGDDVVTHENSEIVAAHNIDIYGDYGGIDVDGNFVNVDPGHGADMLLRGKIVAGAAVTAGSDGAYGTYTPSTPTPTYRTEVWGNTDIDHIWFGNKTGTTGVTNWGDPGYIFLGSLTLVYGSSSDDIIDARPVSYTGTIFTGIVIFGDAGNDTIYGSQGNDLIFGDSGSVYFGTTELSDLDQAWSNPYSSTSGVSPTGYSAPTVGTVYGGNDTIRGESGSDTIIGGVGSDYLYGDDNIVSHGDADGQDVVIGDNARIAYAGDTYAGSNTSGQFFSLGNTPIIGIRTTDTVTTTGGADTINGYAKVDVLIGGVNTDTINYDGTDVIQNDNCYIIFTVNQMTAEGPAPVTASTDLLTEAELAPIVAQAQALWEEAMGNDSRVNLLEGLQVAVADLPGDTIGAAVGNTILIDANAAGYGWFIDPTPADSSEFMNGSAPSGMDLLTVVMHEMGHVLGYGDVYDNSSDIMDGELAAGTRYTIPALAEIGDTSLSGGGWAFGENKGEETGLVSLGADRAAERLSDMAIKPGKSWLADFVLNTEGKDSNPNKGIAVII